MCTRRFFTWGWDSGPATACRFSGGSGEGGVATTYVHESQLLGAWARLRDRKILFSVFVLGGLRLNRQPNFTDSLQARVRRSPNVSLHDVPNLMMYPIDGRWLRRKLS